MSSSSGAEAGDESSGLVSVELIGCLSDGGAHNLAVNRLEIRHSLDNLWCVLLPVDLTAVDRVADQKKRFNLRKLRQLGDLVPGPDPVVADEKRVQLDARVEALQLFDLVIGQPELLERLPDLFQTHDTFDVVAAERQDFQVLQLRQVDDTVDGVGGETESFAVLELVEGVVHLVDERNLAVQEDLLGLGGDLPGLLLPLLDGVPARCALAHIYFV